MTATAAVVVIIAEVDLAPVRRIIVAIGKAGVAGIDACSGVATGRAVVCGANVTAGAAITHAGVDVDLTPIRVQVVTIRKTGIAGKDSASAGTAPHRAGIGDRSTNGTTVPTMIGIGGGVHLATVCLQAVTVRKTGSATLDVAGPGHASRSGHMRRRTRVAARATIAHVNGRIDLAAVRGIGIAIGISRVATANAAISSVACPRSVLHVRAANAAIAAIVRVGILVDLATIGGVQVAVQEAGVATPNAAVAADTGRTGIGKRRTNIPASAAIVGVRRDYGAKAIALCLVGRASGGEIRPRIVVREGITRVQIKLTVIIAGGNGVIRAGVASGAVLDDEIPNAIRGESPAVIERGQVSFDTVGRSQGMDAGAGSTVAIAVAGVVFHEAGDADDYSIAKVGPGDATTDCGSFPGADASGTIGGHDTRINGAAETGDQPGAAVVGNPQVLEVRIGGAAAPNPVPAPATDCAVIEREVLHRQTNRHSLKRPGNSSKSETFQIKSDSAGLHHNSVLTRSAAQICGEIVGTRVGNRERQGRNRRARLDLGERFHGRPRRARWDEIALGKGGCHHPEKAAQHHAQKPQNRLFHKEPGKRNHATKSSRWIASLLLRSLWTGWVRA